MFPFLEGKCWEGVPGCRGECVSVSKKLLVFSSVHLLVAGPLDSGDLPLSGPPHRLVRPSVPFWGRAQLRRQEEAQIPAQPASIALLRSAFTAGKRARGTGRSPTTGRLAGGRASATAAGAQTCLLPGAGAPCRLGRPAHPGVRRAKSWAKQASPWLLCAVVTLMYLVFLVPGRAEPSGYSLFLLVGWGWEVELAAFREFPPQAVG